MINDWGCCHLSIKEPIFAPQCLAIIHRPHHALTFVSAGGLFAFPHSSAGCEFPSEWDGIWFQSTVRPYIAIASAEMSGKGRCVERDRAGEKYILRA